MAKIDTDELRDYLEDYCGTAAFSGLRREAGLRRPNP